MTQLCCDAEQSVWIKQTRSRVKSYFTKALLSFHMQICHSLQYSRQFKSSTSARRLSHFLITELKGTSEAYLQPADSALTFSPFLYYPLNKSEPERSVALCNESSSRVMKLVWNKESGSNIKLCPITIITDLSIGWEGGDIASALAQSKPIVLIATWN